MYIHFNRNYQKIIWLLIGFFACCFLTNKVLALDNTNDGFVVNGVTINNELIDNIWSNIEGKTKYEINHNYTDNTYVYHKENFPYMYIETLSSSVLIFFSPTNEFSSWYSSNRIATLNSNYVIRIEIYNDNFYYTFDRAIYTTTYNGTTKAITNFDFYDNNNNLLLSKSFDYSPVSTPDYLTGYKKITLTTEDKYYMLSGLSSGSIYIPTSDFDEYGGRLSYYDNDLTSQPYTSYIQDYYKMPDGEFIRQDFDLSQFYGADWVMFSKYIYLEGEDNISYDIWVPDEIYDSQVTITPNSSGGNSFDFNYQDTNGDIQNGQVNSIDLSQDNPLLGNIFSDFSSNTFGLTSIITAPLSLIRSLSSISCTPLNLPLPFVGGTLTLPCMYSFYSSTFGSLFTLYQTITFGVVAYWVIVRIFNLVKDFKNPDHDEIEVIDL